MVLVITGLLETLPKDKNESILFLGEWCKLYKHKNIYENYTHATLPYHWDDRKKLYSDTQYIDELYEKYLDLLKNNLNNIHKVSFSTSYWRIIIGPWLNYFLEMVYDRYLSIERASIENIDYVSIVDIKDEDVVPRNMTDFIQLFPKDTWNQYIYQNIISEFNIRTKKMQDNINSEKIENHKKISYKNTIKKIFFFFNKFNNIHFFSSYINVDKLMTLQIKLKQIPTLGYTRDATIDVNYSNELRNAIALPKSEIKFENILIALLRKQIPKYYLEGYTEFKNKIFKMYPKNSKVIFTANAYNSDDGFKFWAAEMKEKGSKYIVGQHGGHHGMGLFSSHEKHQILSSDRYFSWGWKDDYYRKIIPVSAVKLKQKISHNPNGDILVVMMSFPRNSYHIMAMPISGQMLHYINDQIKLIEQVDDTVKKLLKLRVYKNDYGWEIKQRLIDKGFHLNIESDTNLNKAFIKRLFECRLCITTYNATTYLETFSANYPTLLYWDPYYWELNEQAKPFFNLLKEVGILHHTESSLSEKLNEIYENPMFWWMSDEVQNAKNLFCTQYANKNGNYIEEYKKEFTSIIEES